MSEWPMMSLHEAGVQLFDCEHRTPAPNETGFPYIAIPQIKEGRLDLTNVRYISHDDFVDWTKKTCPQPWDVILSRRCNPGENAYVPPHLKCALGQNLVILRSNGSKVIPEFLRWLVRGPYWSEQVQTFLNVGAVFDSLKCQDIPNFRLPIPPLPEQRAIAHILGTLDDKIELNRRMNETLEAMARAIFKSWFVDFDPVRAKAEGRDTGLPKEIADLFPNSFEETELGEVPRGWAVKSLPEAMEVNPSRSLRKGEKAPYLDMGNMPTTSARALQYYEREFGSGMKFVNNDTLIARITPCLENGKTCFVDFLEERQVGWGSTEYIVLSPKEPLPPEFAYFLARTEVFRAFAISNMTGTSGRQRVPAESLNQFMVAIPSSKIAERFGEFASSIIAVMKANDAESRTLAELRDTLLPKLISGELQVKDTQKIMDCVYDG